MPTVLVVDDSEVDRRLAGGLLAKQSGRDIVYAADGRAALAQFATAIPDLVLTDLQMPELDGLELVTAIKSDYPLVPVILMTAQGSEEIAAEALRRGAASYVPKRNLSDDLVETVERVLAASCEDRASSRLMHHLVDCEESFEIGADLCLIHALSAQLQQQVRCLALHDEAERVRVGLALEEALKNAYYHGCFEVGSDPRSADHRQLTAIVNDRQHAEPYCERRIFVKARLSREQAEFTVRDQGPGFDPSRLLPPAESISRDSSTGRGVILMRTIMDEVRFNATGNEITLVKRAPHDDDAET